MHCKQASRLMVARLDGLLDQVGITELEKHLTTCDTCRAEWQRLCALDHLFRSAPTKLAPVHLRAQVMVRINRREQARRAIFGGLALALGTTAVALLTLVPVALVLLENLGIGPAVVIGGWETVSQLLILIDALSRTLLVLLDQLTIPLIVLGACSLTIALVLNGLWIATMRRLRVAHLRHG